MIVASLLFVVAAVVLLVLGLVAGVNAYLVGSIAASLLAVVTLIISGRQDAARRAVEAQARATRRNAEGPTAALEAAERVPVDRATGRLPRTGAPADVAPRAGGPADLPGPRGGRQPYGVRTRVAVHPGHEDEDALIDEPPVQATSAGDAARVARLAAEVLVIDGRPRYHLGDCDHLHGRRITPVPAREAVELGFTPCARCEPDSELLAVLREA